MPTVYNKICKNCGKRYEGQGNMYCSYKCKYEGMKGGEYVKCPVCGKTSYRYPSQIAKGYKNYCSKKCWYSVMGEHQAKNPKRVKIWDNIRKKGNETNRGRKLTEEHLKKIRQASRKNARYGSKSNLWKGGVSDKWNRIRNGWRYKEWRRKVLERDNYTCRECSAKKNKMHAHHIKSFSRYKKLRYVVSNGKTLCSKCHSKYHKSLKNLKSY